MVPMPFRAAASRGAVRTWPVLMRALALGGLLLVAAAPAIAQEVAPRLTGAMVVTELAKAEQAIHARAAGTPAPALASVAAQLAQISTSLQGKLGTRADEPLAIIDAGTRDAALRADAAAKQAQAWLAVSTVACTDHELAAMHAALSASLAALARDTATQKAPPPMIDGIQTLQRQPVFALRQGAPAPAKLVLTGTNLVDVRCANPVVTAIGPDGRALATQPRLIAAQPGQVEIAWPDLDALPTGGYRLQLVATHKVFLLGCQASPPASVALALLPPARFTVNYTLTATCAGAAAPVGTGTFTLDAGKRLASRTLDASACAEPTGYAVAGTVQAGEGKPASFGPITQSADASSTAGIGHGLTLSWNPSLRQLLVRAAGDGCKGVY